MKIINYDSDLAYIQKEETEKKAKERKEEEIKEHKKSLKQSQIACPIVFFILGFIGRLLFMWEIDIKYVKGGLCFIYGLVTLMTIIFFVAMISGGKSYIKDIKEHISYTALTQYWLLTYYKLYKTQTTELDKMYSSYCLKITTVRPDDIVEEDRIWLSDFEVLKKAYIKEPEIDLAGEIIYLPYIKENSTEKENT